MSFQPGDTLERYTIEALLGEGGMAVVYKVRHTMLDKLYALKVVKVLHPKTKARMLREGQVQARIKHPNVVQIIDILDVSGSPGLIMEYIDGMSLDEWLQDRVLSFMEVEAIFLDVLNAVGAAHELNIVHRDLKPSNIMIVEEEGKIIPKVCDFGLAKAIQGDNDSFTRSGVAMGTPAYMAPEQVRNSKLVDRRADIFSLGVLLYELVTGKRAFSGKDTFELLNAVVHLAHISPENYVSNVPLRFQKAIDAALIKDPEFRVPNCSILKEILLGKKEWQTADLHGKTRTFDEIDLFAETNRSRNSEESADQPTRELVAGHETVLPSEAVPEADANATKTGPSLSINPDTEKQTASDQKSSRKSVGVPLTIGGVLLGLVALFVFQTKTSQNTDDGIQQNTPETIVKPKYTPSFSCEDSALSSLDKRQLRRARSEVSAQYGKRFEDPILQADFQRQAWYQASDSFQETQLSESDRTCIARIDDWEKNAKVLFAGQIDLNGDGTAEDIKLFSHRPLWTEGSKQCSKQEACSLVLRIAEKRHTLAVAWKEGTTEGESSMKILSIQKGQGLQLLFKDEKNKKVEMIFSYDGQSIAAKKTSKAQKPKEPKPEADASESYATVAFSGAKTIRLVRSGKSYAAGKVPPGRYSLYATFSGGEIQVGSVRLKAGQRKKIVCDPDFMSCN